MPVKNLETLRVKSISIQDSMLRGNSLEIKISFERAASSSKVGLVLNDDEHEYPLSVDWNSGELNVLREKSRLEQFKPAGPLNLHVFIDHSVVEVFVNERESLTTWLRPVLSGSGAWTIRLLCQANEIEAWELS